MEDPDEETHAAPTASTGGRTLGGSSAPQPIPTTSSAPAPSSTRNKQAPQKKFATLGDLGGGAHAGHGHDDEDDSDYDEKQDLFAGGEKSALAVQNPEDLKKRIVTRAKQYVIGTRDILNLKLTLPNHRNMQRPGGDDPRGPTSRFTGTARTLGGDDAPSRVIEDPTADMPRRAPPVERHLHFWADGFSVDDGPLYRTDDPRNAAILEMIKEGRAPLEVMNAQRDQEVDVKLERHEGNYVQPKKKYKPFSGGGQRLGSPTPGVGSTISSQPPPASASRGHASSSSPASATVDVDESQPTVSLQIRFGDGTRTSSRFNTTHTVGDVYSFVNESNPNSSQRSWVLMTTFPSKELSDKSIALGDLPEFKRGGVVIQKWQ